MGWMRYRNFGFMWEPMGRQELVFLTDMVKKLNVAALEEARDANDRAKAEVEAMAVGKERDGREEGGEE